MTPTEVLADGFDRIAQEIPALLEGLSQEQLAVRITPAANSIGWLVWHLLRVQDDHVADAAGAPQVWTTHGFVRQFDLPFDDTATGYGQTGAEVGQVRPTAALLTEYAAAVTAATSAFLEGLSPEDLDRIVDTRWNPAVTLGVRLISVMNDDTQHLGQAAFLRGLL